MVSKRIRREAMDYYLTKNNFYIMGCDTALPYMEYGLDPPSDPHIQRLSIAFDSRALDTNHEQIRLALRRQTWDRMNPHGTQTEWRSYTHHHLEWKIMHSRWLRLTSQVHSLVLKRLEVNFQNCNCTYNEVERDEIRVWVQTRRKEMGMERPRLTFERSMDEEGLVR
ncbi:hypothetical protein B0A48_17339 [Cryoendolithus antarcticus]|uniref:Uncharacterized protein n=1 Tax=Cryoendolithus antarcticus TaxID=1507870 RepID=A0A1V8SCI6_9PEZI|nr:hypothetical protein B0A48_17339 [Cryoendolithus antarcticus]